MRVAANLSQIDRIFLDEILTQICAKVINLYKKDNVKYGLCGSVVLDEYDRMVFGIYHPKTGVHAERDAIDNYLKKYKMLPGKKSVIITTCSPCTDPMPNRKGSSCQDMINKTDFKLVYAGFRDPTQHTFTGHQYKLIITDNDKLNTLCAMFATSWINK